MFLFSCLTLKPEISKENKFLLQASLHLNCVVKHQDSC